jgi:hypothetical protein
MGRVIRMGRPCTRRGTPRQVRGWPGGEAPWQDPPVRNALCLLSLFALTHCGGAVSHEETTPPPSGPLELDARVPSDAFVIAARSAMGATENQACWLVVVGPAVPRPEGGRPVVVLTGEGRSEAFVDCGQDPFPDVLIGRARFLIATVGSARGYLIASSFGAYGASYSPMFVFGQGPVSDVLGDREPDAVTLLELVPIGYETTDNELFQVVSDGVGVEGATPDLNGAMTALLGHAPIGACADGTGGVLSGELAVRADGTVGFASFWASTLSSAAVDECVVAALRTVQFAPTGHPWMFAISIQPELFVQ